MTVRIQEEAFDAGAELTALTKGRADIGASVTFVGQVRDMSDGRPLTAMTLEHYGPMVQVELGHIERDARARFGITDCLIVHRYGELKPGDPIVLVVTTAPSRGPAFRAAEFIMDYLKTRAPFWKRETGPDGDNWVEAKASDDDAAARWQDGETS